MIRRVWVQPLDRPLTRTELNQLRAVWSAVPHVRCKGLCAASCTQVPLMPIEALYLVEKHGAEIQPGTHPGGKGREPGSGDTYMAPTLGVHQPCQFLVNDRCSIYDERPLLCRIYGHPIAETLACPHGCVIRRPMDPRLVADLMFRAVRILNKEAPERPRDQADYRRGFDLLYREWDEMVLLAEDDECEKPGADD